MTSTNVCGKIAPPSRDDALRVIAQVLLRIRSNGWSLAALGKKIEVSHDTISRACDEQSLLNFEAIALLGFHFSDEFAPIVDLWANRGPVTANDRLDRIEREAAAIRKELA